MQHALVEKRSLLELAILGVRVISQRPATHHREDEIGSVEVSTVGQHYGNSSSQILGLVEVKLVPLMDIGGPENYLKVVTVGGLKIIRLDKEERLEVGLHIKEPSRQPAV